MTRAEKKRTSFLRVLESWFLAMCPFYLTCIPRYRENYVCFLRIKVSSRLPEGRITHSSIKKEKRGRKDEKVRLPRRTWVLFPIPTYFGGETLFWQGRSWVSIAVLHLSDALVQPGACVWPSRISKAFDGRNRTSAPEYYIRAFLTRFSRICWLSYNCAVAVDMFWLFASPILVSSALLHCDPVFLPLGLRDLRSGGSPLTESWTVRQNQWAPIYFCTIRLFLFLNVYTSCWCVFGPISWEKWVSISVDLEIYQSIPRKTLPLCSLNLHFS